MIMSPFTTTSAEVLDVRGPVDEQEGTAAIAYVGTSSKPKDMVSLV
jgi:hypothetical protein